MDHTTLLLWIVIAFCVITIIGLVWAIVRERHLVDLSSEQTQTVRDMERTFSGVTDSLRSLERQFDRADELSESRRQEFIRLVVDVERRITDAMRDWMARMGQHGGTSINTFTGPQATVAQGQHVDQHRS